MGSLSLLQGIFPTQGSNRDLPHCRQILYQLSYEQAANKTTLPLFVFISSLASLKIFATICSQYSLCVYFFFNSYLFGLSVRAQSQLLTSPLLLCVGSHDSFSYWVDEKSPVGPDQTPAIKRLARISFVKKVMKKWSVTQNLTFREQLDAGIRYFDLRVSSKPGDADQEIYFIHGLFGIKVWDGLMEINSFLTQHPQEIVFLDFNHFYAMDEAHHKRLILRIQEAFGSKLCSACSVESMTLRRLWEKKCQVGGNREKFPRARTELFLLFQGHQL